jgi:hypothetical protein
VALCFVPVYHTEKREATRNTIFIQRYGVNFILKLTFSSQIILFPVGHYEQLNFQIRFEFLSAHGYIDFPEFYKPPQKVKAPEG